MILHEWRVSVLDGMQSVRLSGQGIWVGDIITPWSAVTEVAFVRYHTRGGYNEELQLTVTGTAPIRLQWTGRRRAAWRAMLVEFADLGARQRPDLDIRDGPDAQEQKAARWVGLCVGAVALLIMLVVLTSGPGWAGGVAAVWIGVVGTVVGGAIYGHYARRGPPPRIDWATFGAREGKTGHLPAN